MARIGIKSLKKLMRRWAIAVLVRPISPRTFAGLVFSLRAFGILRRRRRGGSRISSIFISHPYASIGDLVLLIPFIERVRAEWPDAVIDMAVGDRVSELLSGVRGLRNLFLCDSNLSANPLIRNHQQVMRCLRQYRRSIMRFDYDLSIAARWGSIDTWPAVYLAYLTDAPRRIGYSATVDGGDCSLDSLLTKAVVGGGGEHESARNLKLLSRSGLAEDLVEDEKVVDQPMRSLQDLARTEPVSSIDVPADTASSLRSGRYAVVSPGATASFRVWPVEYLAGAIQDLYQRTGLIFYIVGSRSDQQLCEDLMRRVPACSRTLAGKTSVRQLLHLLSRAQLFIGMDSGTAHIAGAIGTPTVVISPFPSSCRVDHPNSPQRFRPCGPRVRVLQPEHVLAPCSPTCSFPQAHCIRQVSTEEVIAAANDLLKKCSV